MATVLFFEEDEVAMYSEATGYRCGIVTESSEYFSSDEDEESEYETYERLRKGTVRVAWHPDGNSQVLKESELKLADRSLMPGDVVRRFIKGEDSQRGSVTATRIKCHLQVIGKPFIICNVDTRDVQPLCMFSTHSGDVHLDSWVGRLVNVLDRIVLRFNDGARCEVSDEETLDLLLDFKDAFDKPSKETAFATMTFFEGQTLKGELGSLQDAKWLKNTRCFNKASARKFSNRIVVVTVETVETFQLEVNWICRGYSSHQEMTPTTMHPPPRIIKGENILRVKHLDCFEASNYQIGDRAFYNLKDSDKLVILNPKDHHSAIHRVIQYKNNSSMDGFASVITDEETDKTVSGDSHGSSACRKSQPYEKSLAIMKSLQDEEPSAFMKSQPDREPLAIMRSQPDEEPSAIMKFQPGDEPSLASSESVPDEEPLAIVKFKPEEGQLAIMKCLQDTEQLATMNSQPDDKPIAIIKSQPYEEPLAIMKALQDEEPSAFVKHQLDKEPLAVIKSDLDKEPLAIIKSHSDKEPLAIMKALQDEELSAFVKYQPDKEPLAILKSQPGDKPSSASSKCLPYEEPLAIINFQPDKEQLALMKCLQDKEQLAILKSEPDKGPSTIMKSLPERKPLALMKSNPDDEPSESTREKMNNGELMETGATQSDASTVVPYEITDALAAETGASQTNLPLKAKTGVKRAATQVKQLRKKKLKPAKLKPQNPIPDTSLPTQGQRLPVELIYTSTLVDVTWQDGTTELDIPSTDLLPIHHLDELEFFPGDYVASSSEIQMYDVYGVVQSVDHRGRICKVKWLSNSCKSSIDHVIKVEEVSVYDIKDHPDLKFRPGHVVVRVGSEANESSDASVVLRPIGQVFELCCDGQMLIQWDDGTQSCCFPMQLYLVGDEATDLGDSDTDDSFLSEDESSSSDASWETEDEEWGPFEEGISVESVVEWSLPKCSSKELLLIVSDLRGVTKKIGDLVSALQTKAATQTSAKFFRQLMQLFRICREFDNVAGTKFFENEELVSLMAEIKKMNKKMKTVHHNKQGPEGQESNSKESETDKSAKPAQKNAPLSRDESGNDSGLEKSPSGSELREIEPSNASQSTDDVRVVPVEGSSGISQCSEPAIESLESASSDTIGLESSCLDGVAAAQAIDILAEECAAAASKSKIESEVTASLENTVMDLATMLTKLCEQLMTVGKVWLGSEAESGKLCISALQVLGQVISSNTENISAVFRSSGSTPHDGASEKGLDHETGSEEADGNESVPVQNGLLESAICPNDTALPVESTATPNGASAEISTPVKACGLGLKFDENQTVTDENADAASKTPVTPAEIRAKVEFNPVGFTLVDSVPEFHHYQDQKHTPVDTKSFMSTIRKEMRLLHSCLPNGIYVKGFESRMDLFSIMIEGPSRTPYEDGLFFFDVQLPNNYPSSPPLFFYISYCTDRLNPNLYEDGKVCVSLLGTWTGKGTEMWHSKSNLLQVLISIQGLILNPEPYYNEAGYERQKGTQLGVENSRMYNEMAILKMVQSMTKISVSPFKPFSSEIRLHLMDRAYKMINRLRYWITATESLSPKMLTMKPDECGSEALSLSSPSNELKSEAGVVSSPPSKTSDSNKSQSNGICIHSADGSEESGSLDLIENSDKVDIDVTKCDLPNPNDLCASTTGTLEPQSSVEALCSSMLENGKAASLPAFPLLPVSKGFKISLSKCLDNFESMLTSIGISPNEGCQ